MTISLVRRLEPWWWTPDSQKGEAEPSRFLLGPLSRQTMLEVAFLMGPAATPQQRAEGHRVAALAALQGWENVKGADGKPARFGPDAALDLPTWLIVEIGSEAAIRNMMSETDAKNFSSPSTSANGLASSNADDASAGAARTASGDTPSPGAGPSRPSA